MASARKNVGEADLPRRTRANLSAPSRLCSPPATGTGRALPGPDHNTPAPQKRAQRWSIKRSGRSMSTDRRCGSVVRHKLLGEIGGQFHCWGGQLRTDSSDPARSGGADLGRAVEHRHRLPQPRRRDSSHGVLRSARGAGPGVRRRATGDRRLGSLDARGVAWSPRFSKGDLRRRRGLCLGARYLCVASVRLHGQGVRRAEGAGTAPKARCSTIGSATSFWATPSTSRPISRRKARSPLAALTSLAPAQERRMQLRMSTAADDRP